MKRVIDFGPASVLFVVLLLLKLTHTIDWSWWLVTAPLWIPASFGAVLLAAWAVAIQFTVRSAPQQRLERAIRELSQQVGGAK